MKRLQAPPLLLQLGEDAVLLPAAPEDLRGAARSCRRRRPPPPLRSMDATDGAALYAASTPAMPWPRFIDHTSFLSS